MRWSGIGKSITVGLVFVPLLALSAIGVTTLVEKAIERKAQSRIDQALAPRAVDKDYVPHRDFSSIGERYLWLLKRHLTRQDFGSGTGTEGLIGLGWPATAESMIAMPRMDNLHACIKSVIQDKIPGDFIECGVWRGGAVIFMRAALEVYGDKDRKVWASDSFEGLPKPNPAMYPADKDDKLWTAKELAVGVNQVKANFDRYGFLDDRVKFLVGWFKDTLPTAPIERLAILRVDADMYESTTQALEFLYPKLSVGGYCLIDDYAEIPGCKKAVDDFRARHQIKAELKRMDYTGVFWRRTE